MLPVSQNPLMLNGVDVADTLGLDVAVATPVYPCPPRLLVIPEKTARPFESVTAVSVPERAASGHGFAPKLAES